MEIIIGLIITVLAIVIVLEAIDISFYILFVRPSLIKTKGVIRK